MTVTAGRTGRPASEAIGRIDTPVEVDYYRDGGTMQTVLRWILKAG